MGRRKKEGPVPEPVKPKRGKPPFVPTLSQRDNVRVAAACGMPQDLVCRQIINLTTGKPIDLKTLRLVFRTELDDGKATANAMVTRSLYLKAMGDGKASVTAAIFWLKCQAGWRDQPESDRDKNTVEHVDVPTVACPKE